MNDIDINEKNGIGSLIQLSAKSEFEKNWNFNPQFSVFQTDYKRHTVFDKESIEMPLREHNFQELIVFEISCKEYDFLSDLILKIEIPLIEPAYKWTNNIASSLIDHITVNVGDQEYATYTGQLLFTQLLLTSRKSNYNGLCEMIGRKHTLHSLNGRKGCLYLTLPFFKSALDRQMFPLMWMKESKLSVCVKYKSLKDCVYIPSNTPLKLKLNVVDPHDQIQLNLSLKNEVNMDVKMKTTLLFDAYCLTKEEKMLFNHSKSTILYQTYQYRETTFRQNAKNMKIDLNFMGYVSELIVCVVPTYNQETNQYNSYEPLKTITVGLQGKTGQAIDAHIYRQNKQYDTIPSTWVYTIPFCLSSLQTQPSGYKRFNGKNGKEMLSLERGDHKSESVVYIFAKTYRFIEMNH